MKRPKNDKKRTRQELEHLCGVLVQGMSLETELAREAFGHTDLPYYSEAFGDEIYELASKLDEHPADSREQQDRLAASDPSNSRIIPFWPLGRPSPEDQTTPDTRPRTCIEAAAAVAVEIYALTIMFDTEPMQLDFREEVHTIHAAAMKIMLDLGGILRQSGDHLIVGEREINDRERKDLGQETEQEARNRQNAQRTARERIRDAVAAVFWVYPSDSHARQALREELEQQLQRLDDPNTSDEDAERALAVVE